MKKSIRILSYLVIFSAVFFFGWESSSYYNTKQAITSLRNDTQSSSLDALTSLLPNDENAQADLGLYWKV